MTLPADATEYAGQVVQIDGTAQRLTDGASVAPAE
jgi:hypothetical protein